MAIWKILEGKAVRFDEESGLSNIDDVTVNFSEAETRENISPTDTMKIILGKIMKWFFDLSGGAASTLLGQNLTANKVLVSDADGKVSASETDANEIVYFYGSSDEVNAALEAGELEAGANIYCEDDTEFEPSYNITENRAVVTNAEGEFAPSDVTATELEYLSGVTGNVQGQIDAFLKSFSYVDTRTYVTAETMTEIPDSPATQDYIPVVISMSSTQAFLCNVQYATGHWWAFATKTQYYTIRFFKYPQFQEVIKIED